MTTAFTSGTHPLMRSPGCADLTEHSISESTGVFREALEIRDRARIQKELGFISQIATKGQHKYIEGFTEFALELPHEESYAEVLFFIEVLGEYSLTSGNLWVLQDFARLFSEDEGPGISASPDMADPAFLHRLETELPTVWQRYQEALASREG